jgi:glycosyltransferase involved in cell wall biosynthesis
MQVLIFTQAVDKNDPVLGFFTGWLMHFSTIFEKITVVALRVGEFSLPKNVEVFSLGKERMKSKISILFRLFFLIWKTRKNTDKVFVHMNKEYVLAGWLFWKFFRKPVYFWFNHSYADFFSKLAFKLANKVFYTSKYSAAHKLADRAVIMPVGIDTGLFRKLKKVNDREIDVLSFGRLDPVKKIEILAETILIMNDDFHTRPFLTIIGSPSWYNKKYAQGLIEKLKQEIDKGKVVFAGSVSHDKALEAFNKHKIFINLTQSGSFDKTILEAMACGCLVLVANESLWEVIDFSQKIEFLEPRGLALTILGRIVAKFPATVEIIPQRLRIIVGKNRTF